VADTGQIDSTTTGVKADTSLDIEHPGGILWVCAWNQGSPTTDASLRHNSGTDGLLKPWNGLPSTLSGVNHAFYATISGDPGNEPTGSFTSGTFSNNPPRVAVRAA